MKKKDWKSILNVGVGEDYWEYLEQPRKQTNVQPRVVTRGAKDQAQIILHWTHSEKT